MRAGGRGAAGGGARGALREGQSALEGGQGVRLRLGARGRGLAAGGVRRGGAAGAGGRHPGVPRVHPGLRADGRGEDALPPEHGGAGGRRRGAPPAGRRGPLRGAPGGLARHLHGQGGHVPDLQRAGGRPAQARAQQPPGEAVPARGLGGRGPGVVHLPLPGVPHVRGAERAQAAGLRGDPHEQALLAEPRRGADPAPAELEGRAEGARPRAGGGGGERGPRPRGGRRRCGGGDPAARPRRRQCACGSGWARSRSWTWRAASG